MSSKQQIAVDVDVTASGTRITLMAPTDTGRMGVIYSEFHPMPPAQRQRAQGAGVPDFSAMAKVLSDRVASACCVDPDDNWKIYGQEYIEGVRAMLAAPTVKAEQVQCEFHGDDSSACEKYSGNVPCEPAPSLPAAGSAELPEPDFALDGGSQPCYYAETVQRIVAALAACPGQEVGK